MPQETKNSSPPIFKVDEVNRTLNDINLQNYKLPTPSGIDELTGGLNFILECILPLIQFMRMNIAIEKRQLKESKPFEPTYNIASILAILGTME